MIVGMIRIPMVLILSASVCACVAQKPSANNSGASLQPATETLDLAAIARLRDEGLNRSHIMEYASGLFDGIGPRLTASPEFERAAQWSILQLKNMGAANPHEESWGDFGMAWTQIGTSVEMTAPSTATFLAQATPWSPSTSGLVRADVVAVPRLNDEKQFDEWKGKLAGKVVLYGDAPKIDPDHSVSVEHYDAAKLAHLGDYPLNGDQSETDVLPDDPAYWSKAWKRLMFQEKVGRFFGDEHAVAVLRPGGSNGILHDDTGVAFGWEVYDPAHKQTVASAVIANENFGRMLRLLEHKVPVSVAVQIDAKSGADHVDGENVIADIPGTDPALKDQIVMMGGHLDSWIAGTGATDNGAGTIIALEAMRILKAAGVKPRRTIRIALWGGEEQGLFGSLGYVKSHLADLKFSDKGESKELPNFVLHPVSISPKPEWAKFDAYFNADNGTGKFLGIYSEGDSQAASIFEQWAGQVKDLGFTTVSLRNTGSTDHSSFQEADLPGFQFIQDPRDYESETHHTNQDVYERLSEPDLRQAATIMAIFVYNAAQRDAMMPRMPLPSVLEKNQQPLEGVFAAASQPSDK